MESGAQMMKRWFMKGLLTVILFGSLAEVETAQAQEVQKPKKVYDLEPIVDYLVPPRSLMRLDGDWLSYLQKEEHIAVTNRKGEARTNYRVEPFDPAAVTWRTKRLPDPKNDFFWNRAHYKRNFVLDHDQAQQAVLFRCEVIGNQYELLINGEKAAYVPQSLGITQEHDITPWIREGTNEVYLIMKRYGGTGWWEDRPDGLAGMGIRTVPYLELRDKVAVEDVYITTKVSPQKIFQAHVTLRNHHPRPMTVTLTPSIEGGWTGTAQHVTVPAGTNVVVELEQPWDDVELWSPVSPKLYYASFKVEADGKTLDVVRERFGFRELTIQGIRMYLNGIPFMMRRCGLGMDIGEPAENVRKRIALLRSRGCVGSRIFYPNHMERLARICDEEGHLVSTCPQIGWGPAYRTEKFWAIYYEIIREQVVTLRNHPSIIVWGLGNEFGFCYGGGFENADLAKRTIEKQWAAGKLVEQLDPTRPWTCYGSAEMGYPNREDEGPMPIASVHYPMGATPDWARYPVIGYWFANGGGGWQGMVRRKKPHSVSEDLYHGLQDNHGGISKLAGDTHYTPEGYAAAIHKYCSVYADGYYTGHLFGWEPWAIGTQDENCLLFQNGRGPVHPDYLISSPDPFLNLYASEPEKRTYYVFNQWFTDITGGTLTREEKWNGKRVSLTQKKIDIPAGERHEEVLEIVTPKTKKSGLYEVTYTLSNNGKVLTTRTFQYPSFVRGYTLKIPSGTALVATTNSVLWRFDYPKGKHLSADSAIKAGAKQIIVEKPLLVADGTALQTFVRAGGKVLNARFYPGAWSPIPATGKERMSSQMFRRSEDHMKDAFDASLDAWRGDPTDTSKWKDTEYTVSIFAYVKPKEDSLVLYDVGFSKGVTHANILWAYQGRGGWLLNTTSAVRKYDCEPAAPALLQSLVNELDAFEPDPVSKKVVALNIESTYTKFLVENGFTIATRPTPNPKDMVLFIDAENKPLDARANRAIEQYTKLGTDIVLFNMAAETNTPLSKALKIGWKHFETQRCLRPWGDESWEKCDHGPKFVTRRHNHGILQGICNDWLLTKDLGDMWTWGRQAMGSLYHVGMFKEHSMVMNGVIEPQPGFVGELLTDEPCMALSPMGKGRILYSTLDMNALLEKYGEKFCYLTRAFFNNLGAATTPYEKVVATYQTVDFKKYMNRTLWNNPAYANEKGETEPTAIFEKDFDLRYFPVNQCGWSLQARNYCPVEPFPKDPVVLGDIPFQIVDPETNNRKAVLALTGDTKEVNILLPSGTKAKRIHFLGGKHHGCKDLSIGIDNHPATHFQNKSKDDFPHPGHLNAELGEHVSTACYFPDEKGKEYRLLKWYVENPEPNKPIQHIKLRIESGKLQILAITLEK